MSEVKVNKISPRTNCGTVTVGDSGDSVSVTAGVPVTVNGDLKSNALKATDGGSIISQSGTTITLGASGDTINLASGASQSGFGRTGTVDWQTTPKTATFTAVSGEGYFCNTSGGAFTVNLPAGVAGAIISLADYAATWQTSNVTVTPNGTDKIGSLNQNATLNIQGQSVTFVFVDSTQGWINTMDSTSNVRGINPFIEATVSGSCNAITISGNCKIATFKGPGTFTVTNVATCAANNVVSHMVIAGGAGSGYFYGGAGGAGGFRETKSPVTPYTASPLEGGAAVTVTAQGYPIVVGGGGTAGPTGTPNVAPNGGNSSALGKTSTGGGGGGGNNGNPAGGPGGPGGSGGGAGGTLGPVAGGSGNTPPVSPSQGFPGGSTTFSGAGGGGATAAGGVSPGPQLGGAGAGTAIAPASGTPGPDGALKYFAGGGGGAGGVGGGGNGAGVVNTGGGGSTTQGGSGIVIIRYKFQ